MKIINDTLGHYEGDKAILTLVELIKEIIKYRNYTEKVIDSNAGVFVGSNGKTLEKKEIYKNLKSTDGIDFSEKFKQIMKDYLLGLGQQENIAYQTINGG